MKTLLLHYRSAPIRIRVAVGAFVLGAILVFVAVQATVRASEDGLRQQFDDRAETVLNVVTTMSLDPLLTNAYGQHSELLRQLVAEEDIRIIDLIDNDGRVVSSSDKARLGVELDALLASAGQNAQKEAVSAPVTAASGDLGTVRISFDTSGVERLLAEERRRGLVYGTVGVALAALVSLFGGWALTRRVSDLESQLKHVDEDGLPYPVRISGNDEIARLGAALNHRTTRIRYIVNVNNQARTDLRISETKLQLALAAATDAVLELDTASGEFSVIGTSRTGTRVQDLAGSNTAPLIERVHPDDRAAVARTIASVLAGPVGPEGATKLEVRILTTSDTWNVLLLRMQAIEDPSGPMPRILMAIVDVTDQRLAERRLAQADKMRTIGRLTSGIAHDFNNALAVSRLQLSVLSRPDRDRARDDERIHQLSLANENATAIVKRLLVSAAPQQTIPKKVDITRLIHSFSGLLHTILGADIELRLDLSSNHAAVIIDEAAFQQVVMNLAKNAADAMNGVGHVNIRTWNPTATSVAIEVTDTGPGIDPSVADTLFDPFVTTKPLGAGIGLGLATTFDTVSAAAGTIEASNTVDGGASFTLTLPLASGQTSSSPRVGSVERRTTKRILLVDDNEVLLQGLVTLLEDEDYEVTPARCAQEALDLAADSDAFDLLLTDIGLPDANGFALRDQLAEADPRLLTLYMSAFLRDSPEAARAGGDFMQKPFDDAEVLSRVAAALDPNHPAA